MPSLPTPVRIAALVTLAALAGAAALVALGDEPASPPAAAPGRPAAPTAAPRAAAPFDHVRALARVADRNGGNRAAGTAGDRATAAYVARRLRAAGYRVTRQAVRFPFFAERGRPRVRLGGRALAGIATLQYSPGGSGTGALRTIDPGRDRGDDGCRRADFARLRRGEVAVIERGSCRLRTKVDHAARAGAAAAVVFNDGRPGRRGTIPGSLVGPGARIPAVSASFATGQRLRRAEGRRVSVRVRAVSERRTTHNVLGEIPGRSGRDVVMAGAHLDSVPQGPGVNDNASGVAAVLSAAESLAGRARTSGRALRVGFWAAEEAGLIGSRRYVRRLDDAGRRRIRAYMNLDMVGSPNPGRFVYAGAGGKALAAIARAELERRGGPARTRGLGGGSDHAPFDRAGIPVVGYFTGAGARHDRCYHRRCDRITNIDRPILDQMTDASTATLRRLLD